MKEIASDKKDDSRIVSIAKDGNKQLLYFMFIFLFIHFTIIIPFKHPIDNSAIGEANKSMSNQIGFLSRRIAFFEKRIDSIKKADTLFFANLLNESEEKVFSLNQQKIELQKAQIDLARQKTDRNFSLPILGISINESIILSIYPGFILVGLCLLLYYRKKVLDIYEISNENEKHKFEFPFWTAPIPYCIKKQSFSTWTFKNIFGLTIHYLVIYVGLDFIFFRGNQFDFEVLAVNIFIALAAVGIYIYTILNTVKLECSGKKQQ